MGGNTLPGRKMKLLNMKVLIYIVLWNIQATTVFMGPHSRNYAPESHFIISPKLFINKTNSTFYIVFQRVVVIKLAQSQFIPAFFVDAAIIQLPFFTSGLPLGLSSTF